MQDQTSDKDTLWDNASELLLRLRTIIASIVISTIMVLLLPISFEDLNLSWSTPVYNTLATLIINKFMTDLLPIGTELLPLDWFAPITTYIDISIFLGIIVSSPVIVYQTFKFINPALLPNERKYLYLSVISFTLLFLFGISLGYLVIVPLTFRMLLASTYLMGLTPSYEFSSFFSIVTGGLLTSGLSFTFPVFFLLFVKIGILKTSMLTSSRKLLYLGALVLICIITPDPTLITDIIIFIPVILFTEVSIILGKRIEKGLNK